jgi:hypothetical protein
MTPNLDWAIKLAIEKICDRLPPDTIEQVNQVVAAGLGIKKQLDRIEYVQIEILKMLQEADGVFKNPDQHIRLAILKMQASDVLQIKSNGASPVTADIGPDPATGE